MRKLVSVIIAILLASFLMPASAAKKPRVVVLTNPELIFSHVPNLAKFPYTEKKFERTVSFPLLGVKTINLTYLESKARSEQIAPGQAKFSATVAAKPNEELHVVVVTHAEPDAVTLVNEAVNALLPGWLIERGVDMHAIYTLPMGGYRFTWNQQVWSFDQLTEFLSAIVSAQGLPGGYLSPKAPARICEGLSDPEIGGHAVYKLTHYLTKKHGCNMSVLHKEAEEVLKAFLATAPRF